MGEDFLGVAVGLDLVEDVGDLAVGADEECSTLDAHDLLPVHVLFLDDAEGVADLLVGIGEQGVGQVVLFLEFLLGARFVGGDTEYDEAGFLQFCIRVAEPARFYGSTGRVSFWIEEQDDVLAAKLLERDGILVFVLKGKIWCLVFNFHDPIPIPEDRSLRHFTAVDGVCASHARPICLRAS